MEQEQCNHGGKFKMIVVLVLVLGAISLGILAILRDKIMQTNDYQFTVTAEGKVTVPPDIATVDFNVQSVVSKNIGDIVKDGNTKMNAIIAALTALKIDKADIQTTQYQLNPIYNYTVCPMNSISSVPCQQQNVLQGYQLTEGVTVKIRDLNVVGDAISQAIAAGANQTGGVNFTIDDQNKLKAEARADAIAKAVQNAKDIAAESGLKLGKLINVSDSSNFVPIYANSMDMKAYAGGGIAAAPAPAIQSGSLDITDNVTLTYKVK
ncbi:MAG TPA: SIMPL domain-containing protein [Candidatus Nanoarchaeia archaeon]|nr:SIMPL domain-containing protein [Candidatus Nanoarchaeia archaeon]